MFQNKTSYEIIPNKLFEGIEEPQLDFSIDQNNFLQLKEGDVIYQKNSENLLYLIVEGEIKLKVIDNTWGYLVVKKSKGDFFGLKEILEINLPSVSAVADINSLLYQIDTESLNNLIADYPKIKENIERTLVNISKPSNGSDKENKKDTEVQGAVVEEFDIPYQKEIDETLDMDFRNNDLKLHEPEKVEELKFEDMDVLYENVLEDTQDGPHSLDEYFKSIISFLRFLSSDINYSTNVIDSLLTHLEKKESSKETKAIIKSISQENSVIKNYIDIIFNFFESGSKKGIEIVSFNENMDEILIKLAEYTESKKINIFRKFDTDVRVKLNKDYFYFACFQIIKNWCKNFPEGGNIYITARKDIGKIEIEFRDNNSGIPDEILRNIFEPSNALDTNETEFGLVLANKIITDHCGKISVSKSKEMNSFTITLPTFEEDELENNDDTWE